LDKDVTLAPKIYKNRYKDEDDVVVNVKLGNAAEVLWPWEKFDLRLVEMVQLWQQWQQAVERGEKLPEIPEDKDPFLDKDEQRIGEADVWLQSLANMIELQADTSILTPFGHVEGKINVEILPCDRNGGTGPWDEDDELDPFVDDPEDLLGKEIKFQIKINHCVLDVNVEGGHGCKYERVYVRYKFNQDNDDEEWTSTLPDEQATFNPKFQFSKIHTVFVDKEALNRLQKGRIIFQVWGKLAHLKKGPGGAGVKEKKRHEIEELDHQLDEKKKALATLKTCPHCGKDL